MDSATSTSSQTGDLLAPCSRDQPRGAELPRVGGGLGSVAATPQYSLQLLTVAKDPVGPRRRYFFLLFLCAFLLGPQWYNEAAPNFVYSPFANEHRSLDAYSWNHFRNVATCSQWWERGVKLHGRVALLSVWVCKARCLTAALWDRWSGGLSRPRRFPVLLLWAEQKPDALILLIFIVHWPVQCQKYQLPPGHEIILKTL